MAQEEIIKQFETQKIRTYWDDEQEKWYFCINDVVEVLTETTDIRQYIKRLRSRDMELNSVWGTICTPHQFRSTDGKMHAVNCASVEGVFRIIQSIPSKKAEPLKQWMASVAAERLRQMQDPERGIREPSIEFEKEKK
ncbi:MAG: Bro-N domain-containing protein [Paludibacteraceae bacterium]|nr:Bro-N domain-containing protein [Paludibacteraceae bacterium]